jgi:hypothetical protein
MGNAFPRDEILPNILRVLPLMKFPAMADNVYRFVNDAQFGAPDDLQGEFVRIYAWIFARPESQIVGALQVSTMVALAPPSKWRMYSQRSGMEMVQSQQHSMVMGTKSHVSRLCI